SQWFEKRNHFGARNIEREALRILSSEETPVVATSGSMLVDGMSDRVLAARCGGLPRQSRMKRELLKRSLVNT
ncbi:MAG: hypothetical protein WCA79_05460, partial [Anaerolineales bacterium]